MSLKLALWIAKWGMFHYILSRFKVERRAMALVSHVAKYFLWLCDPEAGDTLSNLKLQKLIYYSQGFHLAIFGEELFADTIEAWVHGPVVRGVYAEYADSGSAAIPPPDDFDPSVLSEDVRGVLDEVYDVYGQYSAWKLRNMTHEEPPWRVARDGNGLVTKESLQEYFQTLIQ